MSNDYIDYSILNRLTEGELLDFLEENDVEVYDDDEKSQLINKTSSLIYKISIKKKDKGKLTPTVQNLLVSDQIYFDVKQPYYTKKEFKQLTSKELEVYRQKINKLIGNNVIKKTKDLKLDIYEILKFSGYITDSSIHIEKGSILPNQEEHFNRIYNIINNVWYAYQDVTPPGGGKTYVTCNLGRKMLENNSNLKMLVIAPGNLHSKWIKTARLFQVPILDPITYQKLAGKKNELNHPYLIRTNESYFTTPYFKKLRENGLLVVFDENQFIRNIETHSNKAGLTIIQDIISFNKENPNSALSRISLLSASLGNEYRHAYSVLEQLGTTKQKYPVINKRPTGLKEIYKFALSKVNDEDKKKVKEIVPKFTTDLDEAYFSAFNIYTKVLKNYLSSSAPKPEIPFKPDYKNGFYNITKKYIAGFEEGMSILKTIFVNENGDEGIDYKKVNFAKLTKAMGLLEQSKIYDLARVANETLAKEKNSKVILGVNYRKSVTRLKSLLEKAGWKTLILNGDVPFSERDLLFSKFQSSDDEYRVLIMINTVGSVGIDLDDKDGRFPRYMFIIPDYRFLDIYQVSYRITRATTKSIPHLRYFYGNGDFQSEKKILDSYYRKSEIGKELAAKDAAQFPSDFSNYYEKH